MPLLLPLTMILNCDARCQRRRLNARRECVKVLVAAEVLKALLHGAVFVEAPLDEVSRVHVQHLRCVERTRRIAKVLLLDSLQSFLDVDG